MYTNIRRFANLEKIQIKKIQNIEKKKTSENNKLTQLFRCIVYFNNIT